MGRRWVILSKWILGLLVVTIKDLVAYLKGEVVEEVAQKQVA